MQTYYKIVDEAHHAYQQTHQQPISASIEFRRHIHIPKARVRGSAKDLASAIAEAVRQAQLQQGLPSTPTPLPLTHATVTRVLAWPARTGSPGLWQPVVAGLIRHATEADIRETIERKVRKVETYRRRANQVWLLIICDVMGDGLFIEPPADMAPICMAAEFDRVFCCSWNGGLFVELSFTRQASKPGAT